MADLPEKSDVARKEEETLAFWKEHGIFEKTLTKKAPKGEFVFYEGPPTANGKPGIHHLESRAFKDAIPRYKTMRGYRVARRAGWDTHGLPVEIQVEKELGFSGKKDIEQYGIAAFNKKCRESVLTYVDHWARFTNRIGYWVDDARAYFTFSAPYMEVLWNVFAKIAKDGRVYEDYKIVPWCPRCGTGLSAHELAQGYEEVKDVTVTAKFELVDEPGTYVLAWTTTPWTLPGNVALAIGANIAYGRYEKEGERVVLADARAASVLGEGWSRVGDVPAETLIGKRYRPLYDFAKARASEQEAPKFEKAFQIYPADFVTTEDGTGVVHTAVMYGQEDFELGNKLGLPKVHLVSPEGSFIQGTDFLEGRFAADEATAVEIIKDLAGRNRLFSKGKYEHTYPFCWRCKTRVIYYARDSWYIRMHDVREKLLAENKKIHWEPAYIRDGRMGEWLAGAKEWAISRERYWGTPLPIWRSEDKKEMRVVGSVDELRAYSKKSTNRYLVMRHGEADSNVQHVVNSDVRKENRLTQRGKEEVRIAAKALKGKGVTHLYVSPFMRTQETAHIVADVLGISADRVVTDARLGELNFGDFDGHSFDEFMAYREVHMRSYATALPGGESYLDVKCRFGQFLYETDAAHTNETILIITHGVGLEALPAAASSADEAESVRIAFSPKAPLATVRELEFVPLPHNEKYELDLHRPYVDSVVLMSDSGVELRRVPEVMDVWFDSGAMPFAQGAQERGAQPLEAYLKTIAYPADFIAEAIDQTRGWFYTLLAVGVLMGRGAPYRNVISLGHLLDAEGRKMSKSKGNVVEPWHEIERWGVDTIRFWMYSVNQPGDSKNYDEKTIKEAAKVISWIDNSAQFYMLFKKDHAPTGGASQNVLDQWMHARVDETLHSVTDSLEAYQIYEATRALAKLAEDLSQWYVRRARDRVRDGDRDALATLSFTLRMLAYMLAPITPFLAERLFAVVRTDTDPESVHLAAWPVESLRVRALEKLRGNDRRSTLAQMARVRTLASDALQLRQKAGIKVRQPLHKLSVPDQLPHDFRVLLAEEVNVKQVVTDAATIQLDTVFTPELVREGDVREFLRALADARKALGLSPKDLVRVAVESSGRAALEQETFSGVSSITFDAPGDAPHGVELSSGTVRFSVVRNAA